MTERLDMAVRDDEIDWWRWAAIRANRRRRGRYWPVETPYERCWDRLVRRSMMNELRRIVRLLITGTILLAVYVLTWTWVLAPILRAKGW